MTIQAREILYRGEIYSLAGGDINKALKKFRQGLEDDYNSGENVYRPRIGEWVSVRDYVKIGEHPSEWYGKALL